jgi:hypothetical protein
MAYSNFVFENADGIATIRLNDPEKLNALTFQTYGDLERIFADVGGGVARHDLGVNRTRSPEPEKVFAPAAASTTSSVRCSR